MPAPFTSTAMTSPVRRHALAALPASAASYQIPHPFENLTVFENLLVAAIHGRRQREADVVDDCGDILERTGLLGAPMRRAGTLNLLEPQAAGTGARTRDGPQLLLLDEIAGGLTEGRMPGAGRSYQATSAQAASPSSGSSTSCMRCSPWSTDWSCLNFGRKIAKASRRTVMASDEVREIYMGIAA